VISVEIYIGDTRLDLFKDENISLNMAIKNFQNLDTVLTDFTQGFTIPASPINNRAMEHWYNSNITTSFNPALKIEGRIELNTLPFRRGVFSLDKAVLKNGVIDYYEITFYGGTANLSQLFGEDFLTDLDLSAKKLLYTSYNTAVTNTVQSGDVLIPLISPVRNWQYKLDTDPDSIKYNSGSSTGIVYSEFKPAIRLARILDAIQAKYGITFNSDFFDSADFAKLYMWAHKDAGYFNGLASPFTRMVENTVVGDPNNVYDATNHVFVITPTTGITNNTFLVAVVLPSSISEDVTWDLLAYDEGTGQQILFQQNGFTGDKTVEVVIPRPASGQPNQEIFFAVRSSTATYFQFQIFTNFLTIIENDTNTNFSTGYFHFTNDDYTDSLTGESLTSVGGLPKQKVSDFIGGLLKAFNLVIEPITSNEFNIATLDAYYASGSINDITKTVDISEISIQPANLYGEINFKYSPSKTILAENFRESNGNDLGYGDLRSLIVDANGVPISSSKFEIELPFTNIIWEKLYDQTDGGNETSIMVAKFFDINFKPVIEKPYIFYYVGQQTTTVYPIALKQRTTSTAVSATTFNFCFQFNSKFDDFTHSLNFGSEVNPYTLNDGTASTPSLYVDYWSDYITDLYDLGQRRYSMKAILPISILFGIKLNQLLVIGSSTYRINSMQVNLTTGEATLDLFKNIS
jgi:hypothetical protein